MAGSTWTWNGGSASGSTGNWTLTSGPGNAKHYPQAGDTAIVPNGTVVLGLDPNFQGNTIEFGGTAGTVAALTVSGDFAAPGVDAATLIESAVPNHVTAETSVLNAAGNFVNDGTILANGPAGSTFTIDIGNYVTNTGTTAGQFINLNEIAVDAGNTLTVTASGGSSFSDPGTLAVSGGSALVDAALTNAGGPDNFSISQGGSLEIDQTGSNAQSDIAFAGKGTLKLDQPGNFAGTIDGFALGDTLDLGVLNIATITYDNNGDLFAINGTGQTVFATQADTGALSGNFAASFTLSATGGKAGDVIVTEGGGGDTLLTVPAPSTWMWKSGASAPVNTPADWSLVSGPGNGFGTPNQGDTAIDAGGTIIAGNLGLTGNTIEIGGTAGVAALISDGGGNVNFASPTVDQNSVIEARCRATPRRRPPS